MPSETKVLPLSNLMLNTENPRFEIAENQREALSIMIDNQGEKLANLAEDILDRGLNPSDPIIVVPHEKHENKFNVLEGNRRTTALKLLNNPDLIPEKNKSLLNKFRKLNDRFTQKPIVDISCLVFDEEKEAFQWIKLKHTGQNDGIGTVSWDAQQTARFEERFEGKSSYAIQVIDFLQKQDEIDDELKSNLRHVPSSSLQRLTTDPDFRRAIGIDIVKGRIIARYSPNEIIKPLKKVISDLLHEDFTVKEIYYKDDRANYLETFKTSELPDKTKELNTPWELATPPPSTPISAKNSNISTSTKSARVSTSRNSIIPKSTILKINQTRINKLYRELKDLDLRYFPNAAAIMFRVFIELSVDTYIEEAKIPNASKDSKLSKKVEVVIDHMQAQSILDKHALKGARSLGSSQHGIASIDNFNSYVHNKHFHPDANSLKVAWDNIELFIQKLWESI